MHITTRTSLVAFSKDGASALLEVSQHGPEGGGSLSYRMVGGKRSSEFKLSSDFSPGDGSRPQQIDERSCAKSAEALAALAKGFDRIEIDVAACAKPEERHAIVGLRGEPALSRWPPRWFPSRLVAILDS